MAKHENAPANDEDIHPLSRKLLFLGDHKFIDNFIWLPIIGLVITVMAGFIYPFPEGYAAPWDFFASWAILGFIAYSFVVLSAGPLFKLLARDESYYGEGGDDD